MAECEHEVSVGILKSDLQASEMTQWIKVLATTPANTCSVPMVEGENQLLEAVPDLNMCTVARTR